MLVPDHLWRNWGEPRYLVIHTCIHIDFTDAVISRSSVFTQISLPDALRGRIHYTTTIAHCDSTLWKVINIGGVYEWPLGATPDTLVPVLETVIVELSEY